MEQSALRTWVSCSYGQLILTNLGSNVFTRRYLHISNNYMEWVYILQHLRIIDLTFLYDWFYLTMTIQCNLQTTLLCTYWILSLLNQICSLIHWKKILTDLIVTLTLSVTMDSPSRGLNTVRNFITFENHFQAKSVEHSSTRTTRTMKT